MRFMFSLLLVIAISKSIFAYEFRNYNYFVDIGAGLALVDNLADKKTSLSTSFKIGKNLSKQISVFYFNYSSSVDFPNFHGLKGVGATYYFSPTVESIYLLAGVGKGHKESGDASSYNTKRLGLGHLLGLGYEMETNKHIEFTIFSIEDTSSVQFTVNRLFY